MKKLKIGDIIKSPVIHKRSLVDKFFIVTDSNKPDHFLLENLRGDEFRCIWSFLEQQDLFILSPKERKMVELLFL